MSESMVQAQIRRLESQIAALRAENERIMDLLRRCLPIIIIDAKARHLFDGFRPQRRPQDDFLDEVKAALKGEGK